VGNEGSINVCRPRIAPTGLQAVVRRLYPALNFDSGLRSVANRAIGFVDAVNQPKPGRHRFNSKHGRRPPVVDWTRRGTATRIDIDALPIGSSELELAGLKLSAPGTSRWIGRSVGNAAKPGFAANVTIACVVRRRGISSRVRRVSLASRDDPTIASCTASYDIAEQLIMRSRLLVEDSAHLCRSTEFSSVGTLGFLLKVGSLLGGFLIMIVAGALAARRARQPVVDNFDRSVGQALLASIVAGACGLASLTRSGFRSRRDAFFSTVGHGRSSAPAHWDSGCDAFACAAHGAVDC
jgi:hypothetical protein